MAWTWRYESRDGAPLDAGARDLPTGSFPTQSDAETWLGETWRELLDAGVEQVVLLEDGVSVYGPMSLFPPG